MAALVRRRVCDAIGSARRGSERLPTELRVVDVRGRYRGAAADGSAEARRSRNGPVDADYAHRDAVAVREPIYQEEVDLIPRDGQREELVQVAAG